MVCLALLERDQVGRSLAVACHLAAARWSARSWSMRACSRYQRSSHAVVAAGVRCRQLTHGACFTPQARAMLCPIRQIRTSQTQDVDGHPDSETVLHTQAILAAHLFLPGNRSDGVRRSA